MYKKTTLLIALTIVSFWAFAGNSIQHRPYFSHIGVSEGLSQSTVSSIIQDRQGFMWFATKDGLDRYDGYSIKEFDAGKDINLVDVFIRTIFEDNDGNIWVGTNNGISILDPETEKFSVFDKSTSSNTKITGEVNDVVQDSEGIIWIAANWQGVFKYDPKTEELRLLENIDWNRRNILLNPWDIEISATNKNTLYIATHSGGLIEFNTKSEQCKKLGDLNDVCLYKVKEIDSSLYVATDIKGLCRWDLTSDKLECFMEGTFVRDILAKDDNSLWLASESGLIEYDIASNRLINSYTQNIFDKYSISSNAVYCLYKDRDSALWIGTYFGGVNYINNNNYFEKFYPDNKSTFKANVPREFTEDNSGTIWIGSEDSGLYSFNPATSKFKHFDKATFYNLHGLALDNDKLWVGSYTDGIKIIDTKNGQVLRSIKADKNWTNINCNDIFAICKDSKSNVWIGTIYGLNKYDPTTKTINKVEELSPNMFIYDIIEDSRGLIWVGTYKDGLFCYTPSTDSWEVYKSNLADTTSLGNNRITNLYEDSNSNIWVGTEGGGASMLNYATKKFTRFNSSNLLHNNVVHKILEDDSHNFWLSTNNGLTMIDSSFSSSVHYTTEDGLLCNQFNYKSGLKASDGKLYFGGMGGFVSFYPENFIKDTIRPSVILTNLEVGYNEVEIGDENSILQRSIQCTDAIELNYDNSTISLDYTSLNYNNIRQNSYSYRLKNYDKDWIKTSQKHKITYAQLPPGDYVFEIKAANKDNVWSSESTKLRITVHPPIYKTTQAYVLYFFMILGAIYFAISRLMKNAQEKHRSQINAIRYINEQNMVNSYNEAIDTITNDFRAPIGKINRRISKILFSDIPAQEKADNLKSIQKYLSVVENSINELQGSKENTAVENNTEIISENNDTNKESSQSASSSTKRFMNKVIEIIEENLADELFSVDGLAEHLGISRSSLHRKIKGTTNMTPNDYIRLIRLERAAQYLKNGEDMSISEISYKVGFSSPSYFTKCFKAHFGILPREYAEN